MTSYDYFISYSYPGGFGRTGLARPTPITSMGDLVLIEELLVKSHGGRVMPGQVIILHFVLLSGPEEPSEVTDR
jgi:hypothetical protein